MVETDLIQLRQAGLRAARGELGARLAAEQAAEQALNEIELEMWRKRDAASDVSDDDTALEEFAVWLPEGRKKLSAAQAALDYANAETIRARAALAHAEAALAVVLPGGQAEA